MIHKKYRSPNVALPRARAPQSRRRATPFYRDLRRIPHRLLQLVQNHIETSEQALRYRDMNLRSLASAGGFTELVDRMSSCDPGAPCECILCALCPKDYRTWLTASVMSFVTPAVKCHVVTILLVAAHGPLLAAVDVKKEHDRLRKRLLRCGFLAAIGGTETSYEASSDLWTVHVHLLVFGDIVLPLKRLRAMVQKDGFERPIKSQSLRDPIAQISYLQKFATFHRPGRAEARGRGRAVPLKSDQVAQLAAWHSGRKFTDYLFLLGFRRRGARIIPEPSIRDLVAAPSRLGE
jgi:hypothetical protein